jgi:iron complex transport system substrate-binding protein
MDGFTAHGVIRAPARRIVSLAPSITETLFYLGLGESVVGVTQQCDYPVSVKSKDSVGSFSVPDLEHLGKLSPDLIIGFSELHQHLAGFVSGTRSGLLLFSYHNVQGVLDSMEALASLAEDTQTALERVASLRLRVNALPSVESNGPVRALFVTFENPIIIPGIGSYQYDALKVAGAVQMPIGFSHYERVTMEEVVHFNPEVILACGRHRGEPPPKICPGCQAEHPVCQRVVEDIAVKPGWRETKAASSGHLLAIPCHWLCRPGPRLIDGIEQIAKVFSRYRQSGVE